MVLCWRSLLGKADDLGVRARSFLLFMVYGMGIGGYHLTSCYSQMGTFDGFYQI